MKNKFMGVFKSILMGPGKIKKARCIVLSLSLGLTLFFFPSFLLAKVLTPLENLVRPEAFKTLKEKKIYVNTKMHSINSQQQKLDYYIVGIAPKSCKHSLRKLSLYEEYSNFIPSMVKKSEYDEKKSILTFLLDHTFLPNTFTLRFKLPRISKPGSYDFSFNEGIFSGLKGKIHVYDYVEKIKDSQDHCIFETMAIWQGPSTKYPDSLVEFFSNALSELSMEKLFRIIKL